MLFKPDGSRFSKAEEKTLLEKYRATINPDHEDERDWTCADHQLDFIPDNKRESYMEVFEQPDDPP